MWHGETLSHARTLARCSGADVAASGAADLHRSNRPADDVLELLPVPRLDEERKGAEPNRVAPDLVAVAAGQDNDRSPGHLFLHLAQHRQPVDVR